MGLAALVIDMGFARLAQRRCKRPQTPRRWKGCAGETCAMGDLPPAWLANPDFQEQTGVVLSTGSLSSSNAMQSVVGQPARSWPMPSPTT